MRPGHGVGASPGPLTTKETSMSIALAKRRIVGAAAAGLAAGLTLSLAAPVGAVTTRSTPGLFGSSDPTYDGVYRQSMAVLGLTAAKAPVPASSVAWLVAQQCANGSYQAYRADTAVPCAAPDTTSFTGPDSNSTALGAMALQATGRAPSAKRAVAALVRTQNADGGWGYILGGASDVNSTGLVLAALKGVPAPKSVRGAVDRATGYLRAAQIACSASVDSRFGLPYQPGQKADALASAQGLIGLAGTLPATPATASSVRNTTCSDPITAKVASFLDQLVRTTHGAIPSALDSTKPDWNGTATAVLALAAAGGARPAVVLGLKALGANLAAYTGTGATTSPAALGTLIQAAVAGDTSPRRFGTGRTNLVVTLLATLQK